MTSNEGATIIFKPTHRCNLNCSYCYDRYERSKSKKVMPKEDALKVINVFLNYYKKLTFIWHGGEPLTLGVDYMRYVMTEVRNSGNGDRVDWLLQTNGSLLNEEWFELFNEFNVHFGISWDGINTKQTRGFELDIEWLLKMKNKYQKEFGFLMTVTPENSYDLIDSMLFLENSYLSRTDYNPLFGEGINKEGYLTIARNLVTLFDFICTHDNCPVQRPFGIFMERICGRTPGFCEHVYCPGSWFGVGPEGDVQPCGKPWSKSLSFGNVLKGDTVEDLLRSKGLMLLKSNKDFLLEKCRHCEYLLVCQNGCVYKKTTEAGEIGFDEDYCAYSKALYGGLTKVLLSHLENGTLSNSIVISYLETVEHGDLLKWKNYKYHTI